MYIYRERDMLFTYININPMNHHVCRWISPPRTSKLQRSSKPNAGPLSSTFNSYTGTAAAQVSCFYLTESQSSQPKIDLQGESGGTAFSWFSKLFFGWWESLSLFSSSPLLLISSSSSTASSRSQWALPGLNCEFQSSVGTAGPTASTRATAVGAAGFQPRAPNLVGTARPQPRAPDL